MQVNNEFYGNGIYFGGTNFIKCADFNMQEAQTDAEKATIEHAVDTGKIIAKGELDNSIMMGEIGGGDLCKWRLMRYVNGQIRYQNIEFDTLPFLTTGGYCRKTDPYHTGGFTHIYDNNNLDYVSTSQTFVPITFGQYAGGTSCEGPELQNSFITDIKYNAIVTAPIYRISDSNYNGRYDDYAINNLTFPFNIKYVHCAMYYIDDNSRLQQISSPYLGWNCLGLGVDKTINVNNLGFDSSSIRVITLSNGGRYRDNGYTTTNNRQYYSYGMLWGSDIVSTSTGSEAFANGKFTDGAVLCFGDDVNFSLDGSTIRNDGITIHNAQELQEFKNRIYKNLAYLGWQFKRNTIVGENVEVNRNGDTFCIPIWNGGITTGEFTYGLENANNEAYNWTNIRDNNYVPKLQEKDFGDFESIYYHNTTNLGCKIFAMNNTKFSILADFITAYTATETQLYQDFNGIDPYQFVTSATYFPCGVDIGSSVLSDIKLGKVNVKDYSDNNLQANQLLFNTTTHISNPFHINRYFNDFRDFEPYTTIELKLPYANSLQLDCKFWYNHELVIVTIIDIISGNVKYLVRRDGYIVDVINATAGFPIALSGSNIGSVQNTVHRINAQKDKNALSLVADSANIAVGVSSNPFGALAIAQGLSGLANDVIDRQNLNYDLKHTAPNIATVSAMGDCTTQVNELRANIIIKRAKTNAKYDENIYIQTTGHANCITGYAKNYAGFLQCANVKIKDCDLTLSEKKMIVECMNNGFIRN